MQVNVVCRLTSPLPAALATIGVHGPDAIRLVWSQVRSGGRAHQPQPAELANSKNTESRVRLAHWPILNGLAFEQVVLCAVDDQTVEINCHGGIAVSNEIVNSLTSIGCQAVDWASWTRQLGMRQLHFQECNQSQYGRSQVGDQKVFSSRSVAVDSAELSIRIDAESALMRATSQQCAGILLDQYSGSLWRSLCRLDKLLREKDISRAKVLVQEILQWRDLGRHLSQPWRVVLAGPPNVGKSSLTNALSGLRHSIVHHQAGTTRDWIDVPSQIDGWPISLIDTAGIRETREAIEFEGVLRARQKILEADLVVLVVDSLIGWTSEHQLLAEMCYQQQNQTRILCAWNKVDLLPNESESDSCLHPAPVMASGQPVQVVHCSALNETSELWNAIAKILLPDQPRPGTAVPFTERQVELLEELDKRLGQFEAAPELDWKFLL